MLLSDSPFLISAKVVATPLEKERARKDKRFMGEYSKTYVRLKDLRAKKKAIEEHIKAQQEELAEIKEEIADLEGYLLELDFIDNGSRGARGL